MSIVASNPEAALAIAKALRSIADDIETGLVTVSDMALPGHILGERLDYKGGMISLDNTIADCLDPNNGYLADALPGQVVEICGLIEEMEEKYGFSASSKERLTNVPPLLRALSDTLLSEAFDQ